MLVYVLCMTSFLFRERNFYTASLFSMISCKQMYHYAFALLPWLASLDRYKSFISSLIELNKFGFTVEPYSVAQNVVEDAVLKGFSR